MQVVEYKVEKFLGQLEATVVDGGGVYGRHRMGSCHSTPPLISTPGIRHKGVTRNPQMLQ